MTVAWGGRSSVGVDEISVGRSALEQVPVTVLRHPAAAGEVGLPGAVRPLGLPRRIDAQNSSADFVPVGARSIGVRRQLTRPQLFYLGCANRASITAAARALVSNTRYLL